VIRTGLAAFTAMASLAVTAAMAAAAPDNNAYYSLIRTETGQNPPVGWTRLPIPAGSAEVARDGFYADAFQSEAGGQIVIAFRRLNPVPFINMGTYDTDLLILYNVVPTRYDQDVRAFVAAMKSVAVAQVPPLSTAPDNVFVTGNSLGAYGAQIAAKEFHYGGVGFAGPGIPSYRSPPDRAANFTNYLRYGDPVANHASDAGIWWAGWPVMARPGDHYGRIERLGDSGSQFALGTTVSLAAISPVDLVQAVGLLGLGAEVGLWHMSPRYKTPLHIETLPTSR